jgi:hypothetical protein
VSVDPLAGKFPFYTPYQYSGNNPVTFYDLDGNETTENMITNVPPNSQQEGGQTGQHNYDYEFQQFEPAVADETNFFIPSKDYSTIIGPPQNNPVKFDIEIGQGSFTPLVGSEFSTMTLRTGYQNTIWRNNRITVSSLSTSGGLSIGGSNSWGTINFDNLDPWADLPSVISNAQVNELGISVGFIGSYTNLSGEGYSNGTKIFDYETHGFGVGVGFPIDYSKSLETIDVDYGWLPYEIDTIYTALNNPSHPKSDSIIKRKGLNLKSKIDSLRKENIFFNYDVNKDSLNKVLGNEATSINDFFSN